MDIHGYPWISMDIHGYSWISMDIHGYPWISLDVHGCPWISMAIHGHPWISMDIHGRPIGRPHARPNGRLHGRPIGRLHVRPIGRLCKQIAGQLILISIVPPLFFVFAHSARLTRVRNVVCMVGHVYLQRAKRKRDASDELGDQPTFILGNPRIKTIRVSSLPPSLQRRFKHPGGE